MAIAGYVFPNYISYLDSILDSIVGLNFGVNVEGHYLTKVGFIFDRIFNIQYF